MSSSDEELWGTPSPPPAAEEAEETMLPWLKRERTTTAGSQNPQEKKKSRMVEGPPLNPSPPGGSPVAIPTSAVAIASPAVAVAIASPAVAVAIASPAVAVAIASPAVAVAVASPAIAAIPPPAFAIPAVEDLCSEFCALEVDERREWKNWKCRCGRVHRAGFCVVDASGSSQGNTSSAVRASARLPRAVIRRVAFWLERMVEDEAVKNEEGATEWEVTQRQWRTRKLLGSVNKQFYSAIKINESYIRVFDFAHTVPLSTLGLASPGAIALIGDKSWTDITIKQQFESVTLQDIGPRLPSITKVSCLVLNDDSSMWTYLSSAQRATPKVLLIPEIHELVPSPESGYIE